MVDPLVIERKKLFEHVASHLEAQILSGKLKPGDQLPPERDLQMRFGVGRPAIREALISLQKAGLVELTNGARAKVLMPTASHIFTGMAPAVRQMLSTEEGHRYFQGARLFFEVGLAREAARHATATDLEALAAALEANRKAIGNRERFTSTDIAFHFELAKMARNPVFIALHDQISEWLKEQRTVTLAAKGQEKTAFEAHKAIYEGIAARDPDRAEQAMRTHLEQLAVTFWQQRTHD
ncbi:transcriptional regulator NanR [Mesorhizobium sp. B3-1-9]|uniref:transcriptional regulator NanR n=1 Tax=unclassified Mesorhizobium TaxID=325217 RepID=UPI001125DC26|nr:MULTISPECIES: transcriptional regulator NanR [unclassified Mesorhizobium]TPI40438.1 transcriptional regulator NanR [Mesorhizobium sp. B3-1-9]TPI63618.1 transcriptional regulator NanR [Mesorhizobium sp. B3-1-7]TPI63786.1 transcriptional regulator NanR [Mesorhizobium sp. B3-1-8]TPI72430.1 transcriptional regulator NanR [Mesorhizobium sp. B3-1-3]TPJ30048.1 transcriptional regulator NanR [Mesorhizobium sp. B2-8-3]